MSCRLTLCSGWSCCLAWYKEERPCVVLCQTSAFFLHNHNPGCVLYKAIPSLGMLSQHLVHVRRGYIIMKEDTAIVLEVQFHSAAHYEIAQAKYNSIGAPADQADAQRSRPADIQTRRRTLFIMSRDYESGKFGNCSLSKVKDLEMRSSWTRSCPIIIIMAYLAKNNRMAGGALSLPTWKVQQQSRPDQRNLQPKQVCSACRSRQAISCASPGSTASSSQPGPQSTGYPKARSSCS